MTIEAIRWQQRFSNFNKALQKLIKAIEFIENEPDLDITEDTLGDIIKEGLIQRFEYTHELAWNVMKDYLSEVGGINTIGSKDATREALRAELIDDGDTWMEMIKSRNLTSLTYNEETAKEIYNKIIGEFYQAFIAFQSKMEEKRSGEQLDLLAK
jgi:nucleotidyltransferase substrate binding protein (TIGR01987 family)